LSANRGIDAEVAGFWVAELEWSAGE
jgi:hypothetical protein